MGRSKKPSRKDDMAKAKANLRQFKARQEKVNSNPGHPAMEHWKREKINFKARMDFYLGRARSKIDDVDGEEHPGAS